MLRRGRSRATGREAVAFRPRRRVVGGDVMLVAPLGTVAAGGTPGVRMVAAFLAGVPAISCGSERVGTEALGVWVLVGCGLLGVVEVAMGLASGVVAGGGLAGAGPVEVLVLS